MQTNIKDMCFSKMYIKVNGDAYKVYTAPNMSH